MAQKIFFQVSRGHREETVRYQKYQCVSLRRIGTLQQIALSDGWNPTHPLPEEKPDMMWKENPSPGSFRSTSWIRTGPPLGPTVIWISTCYHRQNPPRLPGAPGQSGALWRKVLQKAKLLQGTPEYGALQNLAGFCWDEAID
ncbi:hypothetical protein BDV93DRAFT_512602 [Ceratobasidium sp. AG-I]|nr:hypothetical protein BDV93DRAFT_512602 [Ceratobasidium sp. AG-I]